MIFGCCIKRAEDIAMLKADGYDYFEFSGAAIAAMDEVEFEGLCRSMTECNFPCLGFNSYCTGRPAIVGETFSEKEIEEYAELLCRRGSRMKIRSIGIGAPSARKLPPKFPYGKAWEQCRHFLQITAKVAETYGQKILFEALNDKQCDFAVHTEEAIKLVEELDIVNLGIVLDFYHRKMMDENLSVIPVPPKYLKHVHISTDGYGLERGFPQEEDLEEYQKIIGILSDFGYSGTISIEAGGYKTGAKAALSVLKRAERVGG